MADWLPADDIVHLIIDAVSLLDLSGFEAQHRVGGAGQPPFARRDKSFLVLFFKEEPLP